MNQTKGSKWPWSTVRGSVFKSIFTLLDYREQMNMDTKVLTLLALPHCETTILKCYSFTFGTVKSGSIT